MAVRPYNHVPSLIKTTIYRKLDWEALEKDIEKNLDIRLVERAK